jgi:hypothetical protein
MTVLQVKSDINTVQNAAPNSVADAGNAIKNAAPNSIGDAANAIKNAAPNSVADAGNTIKSKVSGDVQTAKRAANDATPSGNELQNAANAAQSKVSSDVNGVKSALNNVVGGAVEQGSPASTLLSVEGGFFGTNPKQQADVVAQKTVVSWSLTCSLDLVHTEPLHDILTVYELNKLTALYDCYKFIEFIHKADTSDTRLCI